MKESRVGEEITDPDSHENQVPNGSSIRSVAWREPTTNSTKANARRYRLFGTHEPKERGPTLRKPEFAL